MNDQKPRRLKFTPKMIFYAIVAGVAIAYFVAILQTGRFIEFLQAMREAARFPLASLIQG